MTHQRQGCNRIVYGKRRKGRTAENVPQIRTLLRGQPDELAGSQMGGWRITKARFCAVPVEKGDEFHFGVENHLVAIRSGDNLKSTQISFAAGMKQKVLTRCQMSRQVRERERRIQQHEAGGASGHEFKTTFSTRGASEIKPGIVTGWDYCKP